MEESCPMNLGICNYTYNTCCSSSPPPDNWSLILGMFVTMFVNIVGCAGNMLTLCTLVHQFNMARRNRFIKDMTPDTVLITNLALADLFYSGINLPFVFATYYRIYNNRCPWNKDSNPCKVSAFLRYVNAISEWMTLGLMALERSICIYKYRSLGGKSKWFTRNKTIFYCLLIWCVGITCQLPVLISNESFGYNDCFVKCDFIEEQPRKLFFALESMVPCILILIGYIIILAQIYSNNSRILPFIANGSSLRRNNSRESLRRSRTTKVILMLLLVYLVCVIPLCGYNLAVADKLDKKKNIGIVIYCLYWCQYFINNLIYVASNEKYRNAYRQFLALITFRKVPLPTPPPYVVMASQRQKQSVFSITNNNQLRVNYFRCRTISDYEERRLGIIAGDYELQEETRASSLSVNFEDSTQSCPLPLPRFTKLEVHNGVVLQRSRTIS